MANFSIKARMKSFSYAFAGIAQLVKNEHNAWIHLLASIGVVVAGFTLSITRSDWVLLVIVMSMVWLAEGVNTAIELLANAVTSDQNPLIGKAKDVAAGAVLLSAMGAAIVGGLVFYPYVIT